MRATTRLPIAVAFAALLLAGSAVNVHAQATLTGVVRDTSGGILPGVVVEASSPALIEKVRSAISNGTGQYRITDLPPGSYEVTFTLAGFRTVHRQGVQIAGSGVIAINAQLSVGGIQETITVTGETPLVDTQSTRRESVLSAEVLKALPATRSYGAYLVAVPGLMTDNTSLGAMTTPFMTFFTAHGGRGNEGRVHVDGIPVAAAFNGGGVSTLIYDVANAEEMQVLVSGGLGEAEAGGPSINLVPRSGGNTFRGSLFFSTAGDWSSGNNIDDELRAAGITAPAALVKMWDVNGSLGGPIKRDRLWFFGNMRQFGNFTIREGVFANAAAGDPSRWDYELNDAVQSRAADTRAIVSLRLTAQLSGRNRVSVSHEYQHRCTGTTVTRSANGCRQPESDWIGLGTGGFFASSPEAWPGYHDAPYNVSQATWSSPLSNRLLLEGGFSRFQYIWYGFGTAPPDAVQLIPVTEQRAIDGHRANFTYRGIYDPLAFGAADNEANSNNWRASMAYVTGSHNMKIGYQGAYYRSLLGRVANTTLLRYRFSNGVPNQVRYHLSTGWEQNDRTLVTAFFAQDQWTLGRITLQGAVRYDRASSWSPADHNGTSTLSPFLSAPIAFPRIASVDAYNDVTTRLGAAWDIFGTGKTAVRVNLGKYLQNATNDQNYVANNPARRIVRTATRSWTDGNGNFAVDCDLNNLNEQNGLLAGGDLCGAVGGASRNFGNPDPSLTVINPDILQGWGVRPADWQFGVSVQQELLPRVSAEVGYNRRSFQNFFVVDNQLVGPSDYDPWTYTAPLDSRLPDGGGYAITQYAITRAAALRGARNYQTFETDFGPEPTEYWHGVDVNINARLRNGLTFQGGTSTGRGVRDHCGTVVNIDSPDPRGCRVTEAVLTSVRALASFTVPVVDVLVSAQIRSVNPANRNGGGAQAATSGTSLSANTNVPNTVVRESLGRLPGVSSAFSNTAVDLLVDGELYPDHRVNQVDMRFAKILRVGGYRADVGVDLYNLFNTNNATVFDQGYDYGVPDGGAWLLPTSIVNPRFVRFNVTFTF